MEFRMEHDTMGEVAVPAQHLWGAQTQRSLHNFAIGAETMPRSILMAFAQLKWACAGANCALGRLDERRCTLIQRVCDEILAGEHAGEFPLSVWQTGSGTQTNMNVNEVIARRCNLLVGEKLLHPNDHVNLSQSSNDTFPSALHMAAATELYKSLFPMLEALHTVLLRLEEENKDVMKIARTHLQDAVPMTFAQEISAWRSMMEQGKAMLLASMDGLYALALGGTAVGTGLNAPSGFAEAAVATVAERTKLPFRPAENKFHALSAKDALAFSHAALKTLAANLMKIANDVRWLASGPRCGLGEIQIPANEPGSSIMPGKVNPTQCEALTMVAVQVMGNDTAMSIAASQGNFQLNVFMPLCAYNYLQSVRLLSDAMHSFTHNCLTGLQANREKMHENLTRSLMTVTALNPHIGYENSAQIAKLAYAEGITLKEAALQLGFFTEENFDLAFHPEEMV